MAVIGRVEAGPPQQEGEWQGGGQAEAVGEQEGQEEGSGLSPTSHPFHCPTVLYPLPSTHLFITLRAPLHPSPLILTSALLLSFAICKRTV